MPRTFPLALAFCLAIPAAAQQIDDPANLMGERVSPQALADTLPIDHGAPALEHLLRKLRTRASLMLIVAHPDDEDSGMLTYESRGMGARVAMLTLTRGEGGQNLMSADFNDALGLIRTQELLAEDRYTGTDQFFGTEVDFGFSKTKEETFQKWGHDRVLYDAVRCVRLYRPLVLASVFLGEPTDGHGHHQVSGEIAQEVFLAAADPKVFPEMGLPPWAPLKVYARVPFAPITEKGMFDYATGKYLPPRFENYVTGITTSTPPIPTVTIHEGDKPDIPAFNGMSYVQWARQGLALQKSQIGANFRIPPAGAFDSGYTLNGTRIGTKGCPMIATAQPELSWAQAVKPCPNYAPPATTEPDLFTGIDTTLPGIAALAPDAQPTLRRKLAGIDAKIATAQKLFDPAHPELAAPPLRDALQQLDTLITQTESATLPQSERFNLLHELRIKRVQLNNALVLALGIKFESTAEARPNIVNVATQPSTLVGPLVFSPGGLAHVHSTLNKPLDGVHLHIETGQGAVLVDKGPDPLAFDATFVLSPALSPTKPYFERPNVEQPFYTLSNPALRNAPSAPSLLTSIFTFESEGVRLELRSIPSSNYGINPSPERLDLLESPEIVPAVNVGIDPLKIVALHTGDNPQALNFHAGVSANTGEAKGKLSLQVPSGWTTASVALVRGQFGGTVGAQRSEIPPVGKSTIPAEDLFDLQGAGQSQAFDVALQPDCLTPNAAYFVSASANGADHRYEGRYRRVGYFGLTHTASYIQARMKAVAVDVTTAPNLRIAYLPGTGDDVPQYLPSLGVTPTILSTKDLNLENLKQFDAILLGVRAYSAHPELGGTGSQPLIDYARQGGIVIVQYSSGGFNPASAPFPFTVPGDSAHNVVDESVAVSLLAPDHPLLAWPNRITPADFNGWTEERGHGFASEWAPEYTPLLEMHDPEQDPQKGGLLVGKVGRGAYIYCALALYRQLPEGVPGGYRLIANILSYAKNPSR